MQKRCEFHCFQRVYKYYRVANIAWYAAALGARHLVVQRYIFAPVIIAIIVVIIAIIVVILDTNSCHHCHCCRHYHCHHRSFTRSQTALVCLTIFAFLSLIIVIIFVIIVTKVVTIVITDLSPDRRSLLGCLGTFVAQLGRRPVARYLSLSALFRRMKISLIMIIMVMMVMMVMMMMITCLGTFSQTSLGTWLHTFRGTSLQTFGREKSIETEIDFKSQFHPN